MSRFEKPSIELLQEFETIKKFFHCPDVNLIISRNKIRPYKPAQGYYLKNCIYLPSGVLTPCKLHLLLHVFCHHLQNRSGLLKDYKSHPIPISEEACGFANHWYDYLFKAKYGKFEKTFRKERYEKFNLRWTPGKAIIGGWERTIEISNAAS